MEWNKIAWYWLGGILITLNWSGPDGFAKEGKEEETIQSEIPVEWQERNGWRQLELQELIKWKTAPPLRVTAWLNSTPLTLFQLRGDVVLLVFWKTNSQPSLASICYLNAILDTYRDLGFALIGICTSEGADKMKHVVDKHNIKFPVAADVNNQTVTAYRVDSYPDYYLIGRAGAVRLADCKNGKVDEAVRLLLGEK